MAREHCEWFAEKMEEAARQLEEAAGEIGKPGAGNLFQHVMKAKGLIWGAQPKGVFQDVTSPSVYREQKVFEDYLHDFAQHLFHNYIAVWQSDLVENHKEELLMMSDELRTVTEAILEKCRAGAWEYGRFNKWLTSLVERAFGEDSNLLTG